jgi:hypothetical protein
MSELLELKIDRFSFHRPTANVILADVKINGLINVYSPLFLTYIKEFNNSSAPKIKYIADSMRMWNYGFPDKKTLSAHDKIQILIHPCSWAANGGSNLDCFKDLLKEKNGELKATIDSECKHFREVRDAL